MNESKTQDEITEGIGVLATAYVRMEEVIKAMGERMKAHEEQITALTKLTDLNRKAIEKLMPLPAKKASFDA